MECTAVVRTSQNCQFFIKSSILHFAINIRMVSAPLSNMFTRLRELTRVDNLQYIFILRLESNVRHCKKRHKTSQNDQFFMNFTILVLRSQHPHDICLLAEHVNPVHRVDHSWYISILGLEQNVLQWKQPFKTLSFTKSMILGRWLALFTVHLLQ